MSQALRLFLDFAALTDIGCKRTNNEDSYGCDARQQLYVVCDGMGGCAAGEVASSMAVRTFIEDFERTASPDEAEPRPIENRLAEAIFAANQAVYEAGTDSPGLQGMGTTLVSACMDGDRVVVGNVGDSRAYLIKDGICSQITQDHTLIDEQIRAGHITEEMAAISDYRSVITRAIGAEETVEPDLFAARIEPGDLLLLASDGLTRYARPEDIAAAAAGQSDLGHICQTLIDLAKQRGGEDNITCIVLRASESPDAEQTFPEGDVSSSQPFTPAF
jgi:serine/threonine protein phosphatase PrpC